MTHLIPAHEFEHRRHEAGQLAAAEGLDGLLVCSRGGGTLDRFADVFYLTNFYTQFPYIPDSPGNWSGRAHAICLVRPDGETRLLVDVPTWSGVALPDTSITFADFVTEAAIKALENLGLKEARLGLVGADAMPASMYRAISTALPGLALVEFQSQFNSLKSIKSAGEIELLRRASDLGSRVMDVMMEEAAIGKTHGQIMGKAMEALISSRGMLYNAFIRSGAGGHDPLFVKSALPTWNADQNLQDGQFFCTGLSGILDGYYFDLARCRPIGRVGNAQIDVFESAISIVEHGMAAAVQGAQGQDVMAAGRQRQSELGFEQTGNFQGFGHGIGLGWDDPWLAPGVTQQLQPGMVMCVEKWLMRDGYAADFEETVLVTEGGPEKLTTAKMRYW